MTKNPKTPAILIILGATGDLVRRKITPALYNLYAEGLLPKNFQVIGFARRNFSDQEYRNHLASMTIEHYQTNQETLQSFLQLFSYHQGFLDQESGYQSLAQRLKHSDSSKSPLNKIFYLAVPPEFYEDIFRNLAIHQLTKEQGKSWVRVLVEKPFGRDLKTAERLDSLLGDLFTENQIYRIDHYLAKEMLQNILTFRFMNDIFEDIWDKNYIEKINLRLWEKVGVEARGSFYDGVGALRDMGQNHLMLMLALTTMERPHSLQAADIRKKRAEILSRLIVPSEQDIITSTFRAQHEGYRSIENVHPSSHTETYFKLKADLNDPRWDGVEIYMESGKRMGPPIKDITITFRHPKNCLCPDQKHHRNQIVFAIEPKEGIKINFWAKKPGHDFQTEERSLDLSPRAKDQERQYIEEYQKILLDAIEGDQTLFTSTEEVQAMWGFIDPIVRAWQQDKVPLYHYFPDSSKISEFAHSKLHTKLQS
jgi:glucose-6-phosphate 1-dehydrogenase